MHDAALTRDDAPRGARMLRGVSAAAGESACYLVGLGRVEAEAVLDGLEATGLAERARCQLMGARFTVRWQTANTRAGAY